MANGKVDGSSITEQVIAGIVIIGGTAAAVHLYDKHHTHINRKIAKGVGRVRKKLTGKKG